MRGGNIDRVKRELLRAAVAENVDTIRGLPPRALRPLKRAGHTWLRRAPMVLLIPLTLFGSTYLGDRTVRAKAPQAVKIDARPVPTAQVQAEAATDTLEPLSAAAFPLSIKRVVIDAGHGGNDPGAVAASRVVEKEITLDVAARLRTLLEKSGFEVTVTRTDDRLIALRDRAHLANKADGDIFVSIHVNALASGIASHGVETYYLGATNDPKLTKLAAQENGTSGYSLADIRRMLDRIYVDVRRDESRRLAAAVQQSLFNDLRTSDASLENWGVKRAPFLVLVATEMPAILAEVGCLSDQRDAAMLQRSSYRQNIAQALFRGIHAYARDSEKKGT
jgi:N-acetylmuramoyl-L-alanine amidase